MRMTNNDESISVAAAENIGIAALVREVEMGHDQVILRDGTPVVALVGIERLRAWEDLEADLIDTTLLAARALTTNGQTISLDQVLDRFGYTREQLRDN